MPREIEGANYWPRTSGRDSPPKARPVHIMVQMVPSLVWIGLTSAGIAEGNYPTTNPQTPLQNARMVAQQGHAAERGSYRLGRLPWSWFASGGPVRGSNLFRRHTSALQSEKGPTGHLCFFEKRQPYGRRLRELTSSRTTWHSVLLGAHDSGTSH